MPKQDVLEYATTLVEGDVHTDATGSTSLDNTLTGSWVVEAVRTSTVVRTPRVVIIRLPLGENWARKVRSRLLHLASLNPNWDSYGSEQVSPVALSVAADVLARFLQDQTIVPDILPSSDGAVTIEWHARGIELEIEATPDGRAEVFFADLGTEDSWTGDLAENLPRVLPILARLRT